MSNAVILPLFAFTAALVVIPSVGASGLSPVFWGIAIALPVGKLVGITGGALIASRLVPAAERRAALPIGDVLVVAGARRDRVHRLAADEPARLSRARPTIAAEGTLAVLAGSVVAALIGGVLTAVRARRRTGAAAAA